MEIYLEGHLDLVSRLIMGKPRATIWGTREINLRAKSP